MIRIFYHGVDFDGYCSGAIAAKYFRETNENFKLYPIDYDIKFPWNEIKEDDTVFMLDFSLSINDMKKLNKTVKGNFFWIDHHKVIEDAEKIEFNPRGRRDTKFSGCELTWQYFYPDNEIPKIVHLLGRYDVWDHSDRRVIWFQYGISIFEEFKNPGNRIWEKYLKHQSSTYNDIDLFAGIQNMNYIDTFIDDVIKKGQVIENYKGVFAKEYCEKTAFDTTFEGHTTLAVNIGQVGSYFVDSVKSPKHDLVIFFYYQKDKWKYELRSEKIDVSVIAKKFGGGGGTKELVDFTLINF